MSVGAQDKVFLGVSVLWAAAAKVKAWGFPLPGGEFSGFLFKISLANSVEASSAMFEFYFGVFVLRNALVFIYM